MDSAPAILQAVMPQAERVRKPALQSPATHNPNPKPTHQATDFTSNSLIKDPIGSSPTETTVNGIALRGAKSVSAHATSFSPSTWAARNEEQRPAPVSSAAAKGVSASSSGPPSASMSRSSSRKSKTKTIVVPQLDDANEWPEVRDTLRPPAARPEKEIGGRSASASTSQKKGISCTVLFHLAITLLDNPNLQQRKRNGYRCHLPNFKPRLTPTARQTLVTSAQPKRKRNLGHIPAHHIRWRNLFAPALT